MLGHIVMTLGGMVTINDWLHTYGDAPNHEIPQIFEQLASLPVPLFLRY